MTDNARRAALALAIVIAALTVMLAASEYDRGRLRRELDRQIRCTGGAKPIVGDDGEVVGCQR